MEQQDGAKLQRLEQAAECLRTLAHPVRLRMVQLMLADELTVGQLAEACDIPSNVASEHLRMMQHCGLLARRQEGRRTYYQVCEPTVARLMECIEKRFGDKTTNETSAAETTANEPQDEKEIFHDD